MKHLKTFTLNENENPSMIEAIEYIQNMLETSKEGKDLIAVADSDRTYNDSIPNPNKKFGRVYIPNRLYGYIYINPGPNGSWKAGGNGIRIDFESYHLEDLFRKIWIHLIGSFRFPGMDYKAYKEWLSSPNCPAYNKQMNKQQIRDMWLSTLPAIEYDPNVILNYSNLFSSPIYKKIFKLFGIIKEGYLGNYIDKTSREWHCDGLKIGWGINTHMPQKAYGPFGFLIDIDPHGKVKQTGQIRVVPRPLKGVKSSPEIFLIEIGLKDPEIIEKRS